MTPLHRNTCIVLGLVLGILAAAGAAVAQSGRGSYSLRGVVLDSEGAPVPGANVVAVLSEPGVSASDLEGNPVPMPGISTLRLRKNVTPKREVEADENGRWAVRLIQRGLWRLQAFSGERMSVVNEIMVRMSKNEIELVLTRTDTAFLIEAKTAIYAGRWEDAVESLEGFDASFPESAQRDNALYWLAYSRSKIGDSSQEHSGRSRHLSEALEDLNRLISSFPDSEWRDDAMVLRVEIASRLITAGQARYEYLILEALNAREPERMDVRLAALKAYIEIDQEKAFQLLKEIASSEPDPEARKKSVYILGSMGGKKLLPFLRKIAEQDPEEAVRGAARLWLK